MHHVHEFYFDNWDFSLENVLEEQNYNHLVIFPPVEGNFVLLNGQDMNLLNGQNFELL